MDEIREQLKELDELYPNDSSLEITELKLKLKSLLPIKNEEEKSDSFRIRVFYSDFLNLKYHDAIILEDISDDQVLIMFSHPMTDAMKPCNNFLIGVPCKDCKYSHGFITSKTNIKLYEEPNYENFKVGSKCLSKNLITELWEYSEIEFIDYENLNDKSNGENSIVVKNLSNNHLNAASLVNIRPLHKNDLSEESVEIAETSCKFNPKPLADVSSKGQIGYKLLLKMGFTPGQGLGKHEQGISEPVQLKNVEILSGKRTKKEKKNTIKPNFPETSPDEKFELPVFQLLNRTNLLPTSHGPDTSKRKSLDPDKPRGNEFRYFSNTMGQKLARPSPISIDNSENNTPANQPFSKKKNKYIF